MHSKFPEDAETLISLLNRWDLYGKLVSQKNSDAGVWLVSISKKVSLDNYKYINYYAYSKHLKNRLGTFSKLNRDLANSNESVTVVCGDNQFALLFGLFLKFRHRLKVHLQIQFHGDTYSFTVKLRITGVIRILLSRLAIRFADSIRIVSSFQGNEIRCISSKSRFNFILAPIPIDFSKISSYSQLKQIEVACVGRLHPERGINEIIEIIKLLKLLRPDVRIKIVGEGQESDLVKKDLAQFISDGSIIMTGQLKSDLIKKVYEDSKVLLSAAPREGYGLTLREAALSGVKVVAQSSSGSAEAQKMYGDAIRMYDNPNEAVSMILDALDMQTFQNTEMLIQRQKELDRLSLERLIDSWIKI